MVGAHLSTVYCPALPAIYSFLTCLCRLRHQRYEISSRLVWVLDYLKLADYFLLRKGSQACSFKAFHHSTGVIGENSVSGKNMTMMGLKHEIYCSKVSG